jgi:hypothetical protein
MQGTNINFLSTPTISNHATLSKVDYSLPYIYDLIEFLQCPWETGEETGTH